MKKLFLVFGVLMGLVGLSSLSYALPASQSSLKTSYNQALVSGAAYGNTAFTTGSTMVAASGAGQSCGGALGTANSYGNLLACGATPITGLVFSGGASGGTVTIYDASTNLAAASNTNGVIEVGVQEVAFEATVAANTTTFLDLHDSPITTNNGVVAYATSTSGVVVYTSNGIAVNK